MHACSITEDQKIKDRDLLDQIAKLDRMAMADLDANQSVKGGIDMTQECEVLTPSQVAIMLVVARTTVFQWIRRGEIPAPMKVSARHVFWRRSTIEAWLQAKEAEAAGVQK